MAASLERLRIVQASVQAKEAAFKTAATVDSKLMVDLGSIPNLIGTVGNDAELIGSVEEPTTQELLEQHVEFPIQQSQARAHTLKFFGAYGLGAVAGASLSGGNVNIHQFTPISAKALPTFTLEGQYISGENRRYPGCFFDNGQLTLRRGTDRRVGFTGNIMGAGTYTANLTAALSEVDESALNGHVAAVYIANTSWNNTTQSIVGVSNDNLAAQGSNRASEILDLTWDFNNNVDPEFLREINSDLHFGRAEREIRSQQVTARVLYSNDYFSWFTAQTELAMEIIVVGPTITGSHRQGFDIVFPRVRVAEAPAENADGRAGQSVVFNVLEDDTNSWKSVYFTVWNAQKTYAGVTTVGTLTLA